MLNYEIQIADHFFFFIFAAITTVFRKDQFKIKIMAETSGFTVEHTKRGKPIFAHIDLRKHANLIPVLEGNGLEMKPPIKWTAKMKRSFAQAKSGDWEVGDINNFWGE